MNLTRTLLASAALAALAACAPSAADETSPSPTPATSAAPIPASVVTPAPAPSSSATVTPEPAGTVAPSGTAAPGGTPVPTPVPTATPTPVILPANAPPQILSYSLSSTTVHAGDTISGSVLTTSNVASVEAKVASYVIPLAKIGVGHFALSYVVPNIPKPFRGTYALRIIAHNTEGATTTQSTSVTIK